MDAFKESFVFDNFVVTKNNKTAYQSIRNLVDNLLNPKANQVNKPLVLSSDWGLGKTHLVYALANEIEYKNPWYKCKIIHIQQFGRQVAQAIQRNQLNSLIEELSSVDLLVLEHIQGMLTYKYSPLIFQMIYRKLLSLNKQIILTLNPQVEITSKPQDTCVETILEKIKLSANEVNFVTIHLLEKQELLQILLAKEVYYNFPLTSDIRNYIATLDIENVRVLEGCFRSIRAIHKLTKKKLTLENVKYWATE